ncbi:hypothetical protein [Schlesneria paludicola]|uniref:hypothetical protein n=1 Tax=Schlesneria paludicola TaxID=360056 RepID=UPI0002D392CD|nr:hypothetical protein [Schlesneria paludicola]
MLRTSILILFCSTLWLAPFNLQSAEPKPMPTEGRRPVDGTDQRYWLANMEAHHYSPEEIGLALGMPATDVLKILDDAKTGVSTTQQFVPVPGMGEITMMPYPGGRHPRIGFLEGAVHPQRETKISIFPPWKDGGYVVIDFPEAVWHNVGDKRELLYLAHTHVPTIWQKKGVSLPALEWTRDGFNELSLTREFPNKISMTSKARLVETGVHLEFSVTNDTPEKLTGLHVQMCGMLKGLNGFESQTNDNKIFSSPFAACKSEAGNRWVILGFNHCRRAWGNAPCPCLHADPQVPDCEPGETQSVQGWISFYEGEQIAHELKRLADVAFTPIRKP